MPKRKGPGNRNDTQSAARDTTGKIGDQSTVKDTKEIDITKTDVLSGENLEKVKDKFLKLREKITSFTQSILGEEHKTQGRRKTDRDVNNRIMDSRNDSTQAFMLLTEDISYLNHHLRASRGQDAYLAQLMLRDSAYLSTLIKPGDHSLTKCFQEAEADLRDEKDNIVERMKLSKGMMRYPTPEEYKPLFEQMTNYHHWIVEQFKDIVEGSEHVKDYTRANDIVKGVIFLQEQGPAHIADKFTEARLEVITKEREMMITTWKTRLRLLQINDIDVDDIFRLHDTPSIQTDDNYRKVRDQLSENPQLKQGPQKEYGITRETTMGWTEFLLRNQGIKRLYDAEAKKGLFSDIVSPTTTLFSPENEGTATQEYRQFQRRANAYPKHWTQHALSIYEALHKKTFTHEGFSSKIERCQQVTLDADKLRESTREKVTLAKPEIVTLIRKSAEEYRSICESRQQIQALSEYFSERVQDLGTLMSDVPAVIETKQKEEEEEEHIHDPQPEPEPARTEAQSQPEKSNQKGRSTTEAAVKMLTDLSIDKQRQESQENSDDLQEARARTFAEHFSYRHRETMYDVAIHIQKEFGVTPDRLYMAPNGELHVKGTKASKQRADLVKIDWDYKRGLPMINSRRQKIHAIAQLPSENPDGSTKNDLVLFVKSKGFARGTPMLMGGTVEPKHFLKANRTDQSNILLIALHEEIREESLGAYVLDETDLDLPRKEKVGNAFIYNIVPVKVRKSTEAEAAEPIDARGADESQGAVVIDSAAIIKRQGPYNLLKSIASEAAKTFDSCQPPDFMSEEIDPRWHECLYSTSMAQVVEYLRSEQKWQETTDMTSVEIHLDSRQQKARPSRKRIPAGGASSYRY